MPPVTKVCNGPCGLEKPASEFHRRGDMLKHACKACRRADPVARAWRQSSPKKRATDLRFGKSARRIAYLKNWEKNPRRRAKQKEARQRRTPRPKTLEQLLKCKLRNRLNAALHKGYKAGSAVRDLGCSIDELRAYLECRFHDGMAWSNYGKGRSTWQIDHIRPLAHFDLTDRAQFLQACHYANLQPLWHEDHARKSAAESRTAGPVPRWPAQSGAGAARVSSAVCAAAHIHVRPA